MIKKIRKFISCLIESIGRFFRRKKESPEQKEEKEKRATFPY